MRALTSAAVGIAASRMCWLAFPNRGSAGGELGAFYSAPGRWHINTAGRRPRPCGAGPARPPENGTTAVPGNEPQPGTEDRSSPLSLLTTIGAERDR